MLDATYMEMHRSDGTVEADYRVYACLFKTLRKIAAGDGQCCRERIKGRKIHTPSCAVGIARVGLRDAYRFLREPNSLLDD
jgi:hypothetical protein